MKNFILKARNFYTFIFAVVWVSVLCSEFFVRLWKLTTIGTLINAYIVLICLFAAWLYFMQILLPAKILKPVLGVLILISAVTNVFCSQYGIVISPNMIRNSLETNPAEVFDLITLTWIFKVVLFSALPFVCLKYLPQTKRVASLSMGLLSIGLAGIFILSALQPMSSLMRNHREVRYLITPFNSLVSTYKTFKEDSSSSSQRVRLVVDDSPQMGPALSNSTRPTVTVIVAGETTRSASWQLAGYDRETNPNLSQRNLISFPKVSTCGTDTEQSLPCMFSRIGRRDYDRQRIVTEESLLPLLQRAGFDVTWIDNQSGCKGVCQGVKSKNAPQVARETDQNLVEALKRELAAPSTGKNRVIVLHMMGSHGPAYFKRYPQKMEFFKPACRSNDFSKCTREEILNAYDNSVRYTDYALNEMIKVLEARKDIDSSLIFMSDHGESVGEKSLYLHGAPRLVAPNEQSQVPGILWLSEGTQKRLGTNVFTLTELDNVTHDHLYHTVLGLLDVDTKVYNPQWDLIQKIRHTAQQ